MHLCDSICMHCYHLRMKLNKHFIEGKTMATKSSRPIILMKEAMGSRGGAKKKGPKGGSADAPKASIISKEVKATTVVDANVLEDGTDPKTFPDSEYPDWLWHLLDKRPPLSELQRKNLETLPYEDLKRSVKLDNRARIEENNVLKAKN